MIVLNDSVKLDLTLLHKQEKEEKKKYTHANKVRPTLGFHYIIIIFYVHNQIYSQE